MTDCISGILMNRKLKINKIRMGRVRKMRNFLTPLFSLEKIRKYKDFKPRALEWQGQNWTKCTKMFKFQNGPKSQWMKIP